MHRAHSIFSSPFRRTLLSLVILSAWIPFGFSSDFDDQKWEELTKPLDYIAPEERKDAKLKEEEDADVSTDSNTKYREQRSQEEFEREFERAAERQQRVTETSPLVKTILYVVIVLLLIVMIIYFVDRDVFTRKKNFGDLGVKYERENPDELDREELKSELELLLEADKYNQALRYKYLLMLESFEREGLITWHKYKTNSEYLIELSDHIEYPTIQKITRIYEYYWYGNQQLSQKRYNQVDQWFEHLLHIKTNRKDE